MKYSILSVLIAAAILSLGHAQTASAQACTAPVTWTDHAAVPPPDNATAPTSNCAFHLWAWNTFLWMTQNTDADDLRFEGFATIDELFQDDPSATRFAALPEDKVLALTVRVNKTFEMEGLDSVFQAGSRGALVHGPDKASGRALYYSQNVDPVYYEFVRQNRYYLPEEYLAAPPDTDFPVGAMEFKYSWRIVAPGEDTSKFFTTTAEIFLLAEETGADGKTTVVVDPDKTEQVTVALVGVHVVGVVQDHPEFVWSTFEHVDNAPDLPEGMSMSSTDPVSDRDWTFYHAGTPAAESNKNSAGDLTLVDANAQLLSPTVDVFRAFAFGGGSADNVANITSLNASVQGTTLNGSVWANYMLVGGVWGAPNNLQPGQSVSPQLGSTSLANSTMETFDQLFQGFNCLGCHTTFGDTTGSVELPAMNMNISHIMKNGFLRQTMASR